MCSTIPVSRLCPSVRESSVSVVDSNNRCVHYTMYIFLIIQSISELYLPFLQYLNIFMSKHFVKIIRCYTKPNWCEPCCCGYIVIESLEARLLTCCTWLYKPINNLLKELAICQLQAAYISFKKIPYLRLKDIEVWPAYWAIIELGILSE